MPCLVELFSGLAHIGAVQLLQERDLKVPRLVLDGFYDRC